MTYRHLKKVFHAVGASAAGELHLARRNSEAALRWDLPVGEHTLFCILIPELVSLVEVIHRQEVEITRSWERLPPGVRGHYIRSLLLDEVVFTNAIEGVQSTRRQIQDALEDVRGASRQHRRFRELSHLYLALGHGNGVVPTSVQEIRGLYDKIMDGELEEGERLDGELFRAEPVDVTDPGGRSVHRGFQPESKIIEGLHITLMAMSETQHAPLVSAVMSHFMFECIHPFYDGNGRTGRYLLGLRLSELLSTVTALSLSRILHEDRRKYYRAFSDVEDPLNRGDGTPFALMMMEAISESQQQLLTDLVAHHYLLGQLDEEMENLRQSGEIEPEHVRRILFLLGQIDLFGTSSGTRLSEIAAYLELSEQQTRHYLRNMEQDGLVSTTSLRPLRFILSPQGRRLLRLPEPGTDW